MPRVDPNTGAFAGGGGTVPVLNPTTMSTINYLDPSRFPVTTPPPPAPDASGGGGGGGSSSGGKGKDKDKGKGKGKGKGRSTYNPFTAPFKTPAQIRAEAARLAALSVASEQSLRQQQANEQAGIQGATTALTGNLQDIQNQITAGLTGIGGLYGRLAGAGTDAAAAAAAAAGASPRSLSLPGASPAVASQFANLAAVTSGVAPAGAVTGTRIVGESLANLTKSLNDRANTISANTAKYLYQLQQDEYQRAVAQVTAQQNAERLGMQADYNQGRLALSSESNQIRWAELQRKIAKDQASGVASSKTISTVKRSLLGSPTKYTWDPKAGSGMSEFKVTWDNGTAGGESKTVTARTREEALSLAGVPPGNIKNGEGTTYGYRFDSITPKLGSPLSRRVAQGRMVAVLTSAGMTRRQAIAWVTSNAELLGLNSLS